MITLTLSDQWSRRPLFVLFFLLLYLWLVSPPTWFSKYLLCFAGTCLYVATPGYVDSHFPRHVCKLKKALYGLKQTSCAWFQCFSFFLLRLRFSCSHVETSIFVLYCQQYLIYLLLYVDDIIYYSWQWPHSSYCFCSSTPYWVCHQGSGLYQLFPWSWCHLSFKQSFSQSNQVCPWHSCSGSALRLQMSSSFLWHYSLSLSCWCITISDYH